MIHNRGERRFDPAIGCWVVVETLPKWDIGVPAGVAMVPIDDGNGHRWEVWDTRTGRVLWHLECDNLHSP